MLWDTTWHSHPYLEQSWLRNCPWHGQLCMCGGAVSVLAVLSCCPLSGLANCEDWQKEIMTIIGQEEPNIAPGATIFKTMYVWGNILLSADSFYRPHKSLVCTTCHRLPWKSVLPRFLHDLCRWARHASSSQGARLAQTSLCEDSKKGAVYGRCPSRSAPAFQDPAKTRLKAIVGSYPHSPPTPLPPEERKNRNTSQP